jgi:hypothetical protein
MDESGARATIMESVKAKGLQKGKSQQLQELFEDVEKYLPGIKKLLLSK